MGRYTGDAEDARKRELEMLPKVLIPTFSLILSQNKKNQPQHSAISCINIQL